MLDAPDGGILVGWFDLPSGSFFHDYKLTKLHPDGSVDGSFGGAGPTPGTVDIAPSGYLLKLAFDSGGRILAAGDSLVQRLLADGTSDPTFVATCIRPCAPGNGLGPPPTDSGVVGVSGRVFSMWTESDDSVMLASNDYSNPIGLITKLTPTGDRDLSFNPAGDGVIRLDERGSALRLDDGSILWVSQTAPALRRFLPDGSADMSFGDGSGLVPVVTGDPSLSVFGAGAQLDGKGRLLLDVVSGPNTRLLLRLSSSGVLDSTFAAGGRFEVDTLAGGAFLDGVTVLADDRLMMTFGHLGSGYDSSVARLTEDGRLDASFNPDGPAPGWLGVPPVAGAVVAQPLMAQSLLVQSTRIVVGGSWLRDGARSAPPNGAIAAVFAFNETPGSPRPVAPYPISSPPRIIDPKNRPSVLGGAATASARAVRLNNAVSAG